MNEGITFLTLYQEALISCQTSDSEKADGAATSGLPEFLMEGDAIADIEEALREWERWEMDHALAGSAFGVTDEALVALNDALGHEIHAMNSMESSAVIEGRDKARYVMKAAGRFLGHFNTNVLNSEVHQTESLLADCNSLVTELAAIDQNRKEVSVLRELAFTFICRNMCMLIFQISAFTFQMNNRRKKFRLI